MYKILLVDDEGIVIDSLKFTIEKNFGAMCQIQFAKTGRAAIELSESFRPDIVFMDIQMPGLNGIEAMKEIRNIHSSAVFIVLSAYDKFSYAKQAIDMGVLEYLTKPFNGIKIVDIVKKAMNEIDAKRKKMSDELEIKEKLKAVVPMLENGLIHIMITQDSNAEEMNNYLDLLGIKDQFGYIMLLEYGDEHENGTLTNPVGASVKVQKIYAELRETIADYRNALVGAPMANRIAILVPCEDEEFDYNQRIQIIENIRLMLRKLKQQYQMSFKMGIGSVKSFDELKQSYKEAIDALRHGIGSVTHVNDLPIGCDYEDIYPADYERALFRAVTKGNVGMAKESATQFFEQMIKVYPDDRDNIRMKILEFVLQAEHQAYSNGGMTYHFHSRSDYLKSVMETDDYKILEKWFVTKIAEACQNISMKQKEQTSSMVIKAKQYIDMNFAKELSLDEVSKEVGVSPYYFSKLFKEESGVNFVEYVTNVRMDSAKKMLKDSSYSIKEICIDVGYGDPNYFSRIFKKCIGLTPSEFREGGL